MSAKLVLCSVLVTAMFGQTSVTVRAGDRAPDIDWSRVVHAPDSAKYRPGLTGRYTVLSFLPNITANAKPIARWNELVAKFADKPVQFVWIASEKRSEVELFLKEHPIDSWLLIDEKNENARAYGCEFGDLVVDPSGRIVGFSSFMEADQIAAILEGRAVAIPRDAPDDQVWKLLGGLNRNKVRLETEPESFAPPSGTPEKPDIAPSYEVHISPSKTKGTEGSAAPDFWVRRGFGLKAIVAEVYSREESRVEIPSALNNDDKFDFVLVLPKEEADDTVHQLVQRAIEKRFAIAPVIEPRPMDVYVMTAIKGKTPPAKTGPDRLGGGFTSSSAFSFELVKAAGSPDTPEATQKAIEEFMKQHPAIGMANVSADNTTMDEFRQTLEMSMGRPVIDETALDGVYDIDVSGEAKSTEEFIRNLREQAGLVLTPGTRSIEFLVMKSLN